MGSDNSRLTFITDRGPLDHDPISAWTWQEILDLAQSGKEIQVFLLKTKEVPHEFHHPRIHILVGPNPRALVQWNPQRIHFFEPSSQSLKTQMKWNLSLFLAAGLKQSGVIQSQLAATYFSTQPVWFPFLDCVYYAHPDFPRQQRIPLAISEMVQIKMLRSENHPHWSLEHLKNTIVIPGSLKDLTDPEKFLLEAKTYLAKHPWMKFLFVSGFGTASSKTKETFLQSDCAHSLLFPENLKGDQILKAFTESKDIWAHTLSRRSALVGLALQVLESKNNAQISSKSVYGLL